MRTTLKAIRERADLRLQIVATGMHLDPSHGRTVDEIRRGGWQVDHEVPWSTSDDAFDYAAAVGTASAGLARAYRDLRPDIVLLVGDRVEAFAAASAAHLAGLLVAHVHGGDRAAGQADDALRHAITKLAHLHFPATQQSEQRLLKLGEQPWRITRAGTPGIDGIQTLAADREQVAERYRVAPDRFALVVLHPTRDDVAAEYATADRLLRAIVKVGVAGVVGVPRIVVVAPNNDPGHAGIRRRWQEAAGDRVSVYSDIPRSAFLGLLRDAAFLAGNSSSGIIEAASFGTPVLDVGPRQEGRERSENVLSVTDADDALARAVAQVWNGGNPARWIGENVYGSDGTGRRIAAMLASLTVTDVLRRKLIAY